jgi:hypothetical protein
MSLLKLASQHKVAITKMVKMLRQGDLGLQQVANASKKLNLAPRQLYKNPLGQGAEGVAHLMSHPTAGLAVQKTYNPSGSIFSPELLNTKIKMYEAIGNNPLFAKYLGRKPNAPVTYHEYVAGTPGFEGAKKSMNRGSILDYFRANNAAKGVTGHGIGDVINPGNVIGASAGPKIIDFLPKGPVTETTPTGRLAKEMGSPDFLKQNLSKAWDSNKNELWNRLKNLDFSGAKGTLMNIPTEVGQAYKSKIEPFMNQMLIAPNVNQIMRQAHRGVK